MAKELGEKTGKDAGHLVLGHLMRGSSPATFDRLLSLRFGTTAIRMPAEGKFGHGVALVSPDIKAVSIDKDIRKPMNVCIALSFKRQGI